MFRTDVHGRPAEGTEPHTDTPEAQALECTLHRDANDDRFDADRPRSGPHL